MCVRVKEKECVRVRDREVRVSVCKIESLFMMRKMKTQNRFYRTTS